MMVLFLWHWFFVFQYSLACITHSYLVFVIISFLLLLMKTVFGGIRKVLVIWKSKWPRRYLCATQMDRSTMLILLLLEK